MLMALHLLHFIGDKQGETGGETKYLNESNGDKLNETCKSSKFMASMCIKTTIKISYIYII